MPLIAFRCFAEPGDDVLGTITGLDYVSIGSGRPEAG
jgi:hypothetical protein